jgi:hypothetical protein
LIFRIGSQVVLDVAGPDVVSSFPGGYFPVATTGWVNKSRRPDVSGLDEDHIRPKSDEAVFSACEVFNVLIFSKINIPDSFIQPYDQIGLTNGSTPRRG